MSTLRTILLSLGAAALCAGCDGGGADANGKPLFAFVTNGPYPFWEAARAGVVQAGRDLDCAVDFRVPQTGSTEQKQVVEDLLVRGIDGLAISVLAPDGQTPFLDRVAERIPLITVDADAPDAARRAFVGVDNYVAGRMCGELLREALPGGGEVALFVSNLSQDNARQRRQGVLDAVLGRDDRTPTGEMDPNRVLRGGGFTVVGTYTDDGDAAKAKQNVEDVLVSHPDLAGICGLFQHNPVAALNALRGRGKLGEIVVAGFDEHETTLDGIAAGHVAGTVVQNPYAYGYQATRLLAALHRGEGDALPEDGFLEVPARTITRANLPAFRETLAGQLAVLEDR